MPPTRGSSKPPGMGVKEIAEFCEVSRPNVRKMLKHYEVDPWFVLAIGPVYRREDIAEMQRLRNENTAAREADAKRRVSARRA